MPLTPSPHDPGGGAAEKCGDSGQERRAEESSEPNQLPPNDSPPHASRSSLQGLNWFTFFIANVQTGFGPFIAVYLTAQKWPQVDIGLLLTVGGLVALLGQAPGGALVDAVRAERVLVAISVIIIGLSALALALWPILPSVFAAMVLHSAASCVLGPAIAAISLGLVGHAGMAERLGRNARFAALGNGFAAAGMGACGYFWSNEAVFFLTLLCAVRLYGLSLGCARARLIPSERMEEFQNQLERAFEVSLQTGRCLSSRAAPDCFTSRMQHCFRSWEA